MLSCRDALFETFPSNTPLVFPSLQQSLSFSGARPGFIAQKSRDGEELGCATERAQRCCARTTVGRTKRMSGDGHDDGFTSMGVTPGMPEKILGSGVGQSRLGRGISMMIC